VTNRTITFRGSSYPLVLPSTRDPRLHVAAVILSVHLLGQVGLGFRLSVPQLLAAMVTCAVIEVVLTFRQSRSFGAHLPPEPVIRVACQRDAHRQRRRPDPSRCRHAP